MADVFHQTLENESKMALLLAAYGSTQHIPYDAKNWTIKELTYRFPVEAAKVCDEVVNALGYKRPEAGIKKEKIRELFPDMEENVFE